MNHIKYNIFLLANWFMTVTSYL